MPEAMPARVTGTEPVSECDAGVPAKPTPIPMKAYAIPIFQYGGVLLPEQEHREERQHEEHVAAEQREPRPSRLDELRGARRDDHHQQRRGQDRRSGFERRVAEDVLEVLLADEGRSHERAEDDDPRARRDPEDAPRGDVEVVERVRRPALSQVEADGGRDGDSSEHEHERRLVRHRREVDREDERPDHDERQDAAEVVHCLGGLVDVGWARRGTP